jgi:hypothetical protein
MTRPETTVIRWITPEEQAQIDEDHNARRAARRRKKEATSGLVRTRSRGRPSWTRQLFDDRLAEALARTRDPQTDDAIAKNFRGLNSDGSVGIDTDSFRKLRRKRRRGALPE